MILMAENGLNWDQGKIKIKIYILIFEFQRLIGFKDLIFQLETTFCVLYGLH